MRRALLPVFSVFAFAACSGSSDEATPADTEAGADTSSTTDSLPVSSDGDPGSDGSIGVDAPASETASDAPTDAPGSWILPPAATCAPAAPTCPPAAADTKTRASYRKDTYLPSYKEPNDTPTAGGRFHVVATSTVTGKITKVVVDGVDIATLAQPDAKASLEWAHVWPKDVKAGEPVWIQFHSRAAKWDSATSGTFEITTDGGVISGTFPVTKTTVPLTWVTTTEDLGTVLIHLQNRDTAARTIKRVLVNGRDVTAAACIGDSSVPAGASALITVPLCTPWKPGDAWTVAVEYEGAADAVGVGRVVRPVYPIEAWNNTNECPWTGTGGIAANYEAIVKNGGVDTLYTHGGVCKAADPAHPEKTDCVCDTFDLLNTILPAAGIKTVITPDIATSGKTLTSLDTIAAVSTGDESDGEIFVPVSKDDSRQISAAAVKAESSERIWARYPSIPTINGGKTNMNVGTFAGMADIQGMDYYIAACAPRIAPAAPSSYPLRGPYEYLRNARDNHMPLPTWLYSQGLSPAWKKSLKLGGIDASYYANPAPAETFVQAMHVVAAGAKGFMWFQVNQERAKEAPTTWQTIVKANKIVRSLRALLREGDVTGAAKASGGPALTEAIRARDAIVVPVIGEKVETSVSDSCNLATSDAAQPHWKFGAQTLAVDVTIPKDFGVAEVFEVTDTGVKDFAGTAASGRTLTLSGIAVDNTTPARIFVIARTKDVRAAVAAAK